MQDEFRLCPMCGGDVETITADGLWLTQMPAYAAATCKECGLRLARYGYTAGHALQAVKDDWNRRVAVRR